MTLSDASIHTTLIFGESLAQHSETKFVILLKDQKCQICECCKKEIIFVDRREEHTENKQPFHNGIQITAFDQWRAIFGRVCPKVLVFLWQVLCMQTTERESLLKMCGLLLIKKWALKRGKSFLFFLNSMKFKPRTRKIFYKYFSFIRFSLQVKAYVLL